MSHIPVKNFPMEMFGSHTKIIMGEWKALEIEII